jgi:hypothetical protein
MKASFNSKGAFIFKTTFLQNVKNLNENCNIIHFLETNKLIIMKQKEEQNKLNDKFPGYPQSPVGEDIYNKDKEEREIDPENLNKLKSPNEKKGTKNEKSFEEDMSGDDLDVPGSELDDQQERIGSEDEENNYYSLGGDKHNNLEENNGK